MLNSTFCIISLNSLLKSIVKKLFVKVKEPNFILLFPQVRRNGLSQTASQEERKRQEVCVPGAEPECVSSLRVHPLCACL